MSKKIHTKRERIGIIHLDGSYRIHFADFPLDAGDNFRIIYKTFLNMDGMSLKMHKVTPSGTVMYKEQKQ